MLWALPASLILHVLVGAFLVYGLPIPAQESQQEQAITVALVPPPEPVRPPPPPPEEPKAEKPPEPKAEKPPEPKAEKPPEKKAEKPPEPAKPAPKPPQIEVLKPVFKFGEKDAGPRESFDGGSAEDSSPAPSSEDDAKPPAVAKDTETRSPPSSSQEPAEPVKDSQTEAAEAKDAEARQTLAKQADAPQDTDKQEAEKPQAAPDAPKDAAAAAAATLATPGDEGEIALPVAALVPQPRPTVPPKPASAPKPAGSPKPATAKFSKVGSESAARSAPTGASAATSKGYSGLPGVRKLNSRRATGNALATIAADGLSRDQRVAKLCASMLQRQLLDASYVPDLVPLVPLKSGNVLDVPETAFHTRTTWYRLSFRCEVDPEATTVLSFTFRPGAPIPPEDWARLGLPIRN